MTLDTRARRAAQGIRDAVEVMEMSTSTKEPRKLERFDRFLDRKQRNRRVSAFLVAALVIALIVLSAIALDRRDSTVPLTPPSGTIVFGRWDPAIKDQVLFTVNSDGSHLHKVIPGKPVANECPHWSQDGSRIFSCTRKGTQIINPATGSSRIMRSPKPGFACSGTSPDGKLMLCSRYPSHMTGFYTVRSSDLGGLRRITTNPGGIDDGGKWSPDGTQLFFGRKDPGRGLLNTAFFVVNSDGTGLRRITSWLLADSVKIDEGSWSPDGQWILYDKNEQIYTVHPDGSGDHQIPIQVPGSDQAIALYPDWSPDGGWIVFSMSFPGVDALNLYVMRADGSDVRQITTAMPGTQELGVGDMYPDWG